jgi:hypothetical protein
MKKNPSKYLYTMLVGLVLWTYGYIFLNIYITFSIAQKHIVLLEGICSIAQKHIVFN